MVTETGTDEAGGRRRRRAAGQEVFDALALDFAAQPEVSRGVMFGSNGLRANGKFFAFVDGDGGMIVKLPAEAAAGLVTAGGATPVRIGRNPAREWVTVPAQPDAEQQVWRDLLQQAYRYATQA